MTDLKSVDEITSMEAIKAAVDRLKAGDVTETELYDSDNLQTVAGCKLYLKLELQQRCRSFKYRGAYNKIAQLKPGTTVCTVSSGNHSQGLAAAALKCDCKAVIYMSEIASVDKVNATKHYGAEVIQKGASFEEALKYCLEEKKEDWVFVSPYDDVDVINGDASLGVEIFEQCPNVQTVVVPVGGGGLISGVAYALKHLNPKIKIVGVQMASSPYAYNLWCKHKGFSKDVIEKDSRSPLADGIAIKNPGNLNLPFIYNLVDDFVIVNDDEVALAVSLLAERGKMIAEGAGAASFAAVNSKKFEFKEDEIVVAVVSGGNIPLQLLARCIDRALFLNQTRHSLQVILPYGTKYLYDMTQLFVQNHTEVISCTSISHVDTVANKEHYSVIVDVANPDSIPVICDEFKNRGWIITIENTTALEE